MFAYRPYHRIGNLEMEVTNLPEQVNHMEIKHDEAKLNKLLSWWSFQSLSVTSALSVNDIVFLRKRCNVIRQLSRF